MFSYRHAYHAGNHADVLKHFVQVQLHQYMNQKDVAYTYIDTHSGAGVYALDSAQAVKSGEIGFAHLTVMARTRNAVPDRFQVRARP